MKAFDVIRRLTSSGRSKKEIVEYLNIETQTAIKKLQATEPTEKEVSIVLKIIKDEADMTQEQANAYMQGLAHRMYHPINIVRLKSLYRFRADIAKLSFEDYAEVIAVNNALTNHWGAAANKHFRDKIGHLHQYATLSKLGEMFKGDTPPYVGQIIEE